MALSGLQIFKLLPGTNCKDCGFPTCLAFAMKLAAKGVSIDDCPDASDEARTTLGAAAEPPMRTVRVGPAAAPLALGGETVSYRHEKTFVNQTALGVAVDDDLPPDLLAARLAAIAAYEVERVGEKMGIDLVWLRAVGGDLAAAAAAVREQWSGAIAIQASDPVQLTTAAREFTDRKPVLMGPADPNALLAAARQTGGVPVLSAPTAAELAGLSSRARAAGVEDILLHVAVEDASTRNDQQTVIRRAALRKGIKELGHPVLATARPGGDAIADGTVAICRYASMLLLPDLDEALLYPLLTLRQTIFSDPQKPIQVEPGIYPIGTPGPESPAFLTTNFSLTYFMVSGEIENAGISAHLVVQDCEGMSVLTAWAANKFNGEKVAAFIKESALPGWADGKPLVIPGYAAMLQGDLEECLPGAKVMVGPQEAVDIGAFVKQRLG